MDTMNLKNTTVDEVEQLVEPRLTLKACQVIAHVFNYYGWRPYYPLSLAELWYCTWVGCNKARHASLDELIVWIEKGHFHIPYEIQHAHNTLRRINEEYIANH